MAYACAKPAECGSLRFLRGGSRIADSDKDRRSWRLHRLDVAPISRSRSSFGCCNFVADAPFIFSDELDRHQLDRAKHSLEFKTPCGALIPNPNETTAMKKYLLISISFALAALGTALGQSHAYLWDPTTGIRDLGTLGGDSFAYAVNDSGTVVGSYVPTDGRIYYHGFIWSEATGMVDIGVPGGGDSNTAQVFCTAINSAGNVVGYGARWTGDRWRSFGRPQTVAPLSGITRPTLTTAIAPTRSTT